MHIQTTVIETNHVVLVFQNLLHANTVISREPTEEDKAHDIINYAKDILQKVQNFLSSTHIPHEDLALADFLQKLEIDLDTYMEALQFSQKGYRIILQ